MNKKLLGIFFAAAAIAFVLPAKAQTTGDFQITINPETLEISVLMTGANQTGNVTTGATTTGTITTGTTTTGTNIVPISTGSEFQQALAWMYANGLTKYNNETEYRPDDGLLREEAAKIIGQAFVVLGYNQSTKNNNCTFSDTNDIDPTLTSHVTNTCKRGIFKGTTDGKFLPREQLTRPQSMALLVRIFEGKTSNESRTPRWGDYYIKGQALGLTTLNTQATFDSSISRREMAIYIRRLRNVVANEATKLSMLTRISEINAASSTTNTGISDSLSSLTNSLSISSDPELIEAIRWMNDNGLTSFTSVTTYQPFEVLNREQAAKILVGFAGVFNFQGINATSSCQFSDIGDADASLITYIQQVCQLGIMQGSEGYFSPKNTISKAQFVTAMVRLIEGKKLNETLNPRWTAYFEKAENMGIVNPSDSINFDNAITRYEVALSLYRFKVKYQITQNLNNETIDNQIISSVPGSITTGTNNMPEANVYVDMNLLQNGNFNVGYLEILGNRYKVVKSSTEEYLTNNFVRYGDIFTLDTESKIGTVSFIVSSLSLIEGTIRINAMTYMVSPLAATSAYYKLNQIR